MLEEQLGRRGDAVAPLRPVLRRILADIQERLTFRAQAFIKVRSLKAIESGILTKQKNLTDMECIKTHVHQVI